MRKVMRPRWYCDHCRKSNGTGAAMTKHEKACTLNPERTCGLCNFAGLSAMPLPELKQLLLVKSGGVYGSLPDEHMDEFRKASDGCPACMLAASRQTKIHVDFQFKQEMQSILADCKSDEHY